MMKFKNIEGKVVSDVYISPLDSAVSPREIVINFTDGSMITTTSRHDRYEDDYLEIEYLDAQTKEVERN